MKQIEKAIKVLQRVIHYYCDEVGLNYYDTYGYHIEKLKKELSKPTIDDAIKVVEEKLNKEYLQIDTATGQVERSYYRSRSGALYEILTALKGLKGEQEE